MVKGQLQWDIADWSRVLRAMEPVPSGYRPNTYSPAEDESGQTFDPAECRDLLRETGLHLRADCARYDFSPRGAGGTLYFELVGDDDTLVDVFQQLSRSLPTFAHCSAEGEWYHRNRVSFAVAGSTADIWVGRDHSRYVPGLYWLTCLSEELVVRHGIDASALEAAALSTSRGASSLLFRFFERSSQWEAEEKRMDDLCESLVGVFSIREPRKAVLSCGSMLQAISRAREWK